MNAIRQKLGKGKTKTIIKQASLLLELPHSSLQSVGMHHRPVIGQQSPEEVQVQLLFRNYSLLKGYGAKIIAYPCLKQVT